MKVKEFIGREGKLQIEQAIKEAELDTSGEIRVHIESKCTSDPLQRAVYIFNYLKMYNTQARNGVLIYVAVESRKFAIIGDAGINKAVPDNFWDSIKEGMGAAFSQGKYVEGLANAIKVAGESLKQYFPYRNDDINEQPDEISFGE
ncbi:MAG: TPM domain-containing protein [Bacteroidales bacterium]|nr:TPM domain-containing protein [Bacteroidales bacterium]MBR2438364.1 TPM domain-containing protein [Bacteroidales bacterium]